MKKAITKLPFLIFIVSIIVPSLMCGQTYFEKVYQTVYDKTSREVLQTSDGGYLIAGVTNNSNISDADIYIMKTDASGNLVWEKTYGGGKIDYSYSMIETTDGNYFVTGYSQSFGGGDYDMYLLKIDPTGTKLFENKIGGGSGYEEAREIVKTTDGNYLIVGSTSSSGAGGKDVALLKIDNAGSILWSKTYGGTMDDNGNSVKQLPDGGYIIAGGTKSYGSGKMDSWVIKTDANGVMTNSVIYGGAQDDEGISIVSNTDGSYVVAIRDSSTTPDIDTRIIKYKADLTAEWNYVYGGTYKDTPKRIRTTSDGGYIVGAISRSWWGVDNPDMWWVKLNPDGTMQWTQHFGGTNHEHCQDIKQHSDGGYIAVGHSRSGPLPGQKVMFVKANSGGEVGLNEISLSDKINIYPNPSAGRIYIEKKDIIGYSKIIIENVIGKTILSEDLNSLDKYIDLQTQSSGMYFLSIIPDNEMNKLPITARIIIAK